jgi:hypothetical protein
VTGVIGRHWGGALAVLACCAALSAPAAAQSPDPDPSAGPRPDPAPTKSQPTKRPATPTRTATTQATPTPENESPPDSGAVAKPSAPKASARPGATHRAKRREPPARHVATLSSPKLPRLEPAQLLAPPSNDGERARRLAVGAVALLLLALASATLLAVTARVERRRMMR